MKLNSEELEQALKILNGLEQTNANHPLLNWYRMAIENRRLTRDQLDTLQKMSRYKKPPNKNAAMIRAQRPSKRPVTLPSFTSKEIQ